MLFVVCFLSWFLGLLLFCDVCLLEWSRCCSSCVFFVGLCVCVCFLFLCVFPFCSYERHCFPCNSSVFGLLKSESLFLMLVSGLVFCFCFVCFFVSRCSFVFVFLIVLFFCFESQYHNCWFCILFSRCCCCFLFWCSGILFFLNSGYLSKNISKIWNFRKPPK